MKCNNCGSIKTMNLEFQSGKGYCKECDLELWC